MTIAGLLSGLVAFAKAMPIVDGWVQQFIFLWIQSQKAEVRTDINDALALAARAETDEQRYSLSGKWQEIFKKPRVST